MQPVDRKLNIFKDHILRRKLKSSRQRYQVVRLFFETRGHVNVDGFYRQIHEVNPRIGLTTVYRTLKLLANCGLAVERKFGDGQNYYENSEIGDHHDHLICSSCGKIMEFRDDRIENIQEEIAQKHNFEITDHRLEIYGRCQDCKKV